MLKTTIKEKLEHITEHSKEDSTLFTEGSLAYKYIYDILDYIIRRNYFKLDLSTEVREDIKQNIIKSYIIRIKNNEDPIRHLFTYLCKSVVSEITDLSTNKYLGKPYIDFNREPGLQYDPNIYIDNNSQNDMEAIISMEDNCKVVIKSVNKLLMTTPLPVKHKKLLMFPLLLSIARRDQEILKSYHLRTKVSLKKIYQVVGEPIDFLQA